MEVDATGTARASDHASRNAPFLSEWISRSARAPAGQALAGARAACVCAASSGDAIPTIPRTCFLGRRQRARSTSSSCDARFSGPRRRGIAGGISRAGVQRRRRHRRRSDPAPSPSRSRHPHRRRKSRGDRRHRRLHRGRPRPVRSRSVAHPVAQSRCRAALPRPRPHPAHPRYLCPPRPHPRRPAPG